MKIVIDIPDDIYQHIAVFRHFNNYDKKYLIDAFKNCIALPENHGRVRYIKCEVLDKIRAEIADLDDADYDYEGYYKAVTDAVKIIDKYKAESEESDADSD